MGVRGQPASLAFLRDLRPLALLARKILVDLGPGGIPVFVPESVNLAELTPLLRDVVVDEDRGIRTPDRLIKRIPLYETSRFAAVLRSNSPFDSIGTAL
jgi:hypothetical protein